MLRLSFLTFVLILALNVTPETLAQQISIRSETAKAAELSDGAYGVAGHDARFVLYRQGELIVMEYVDGKAEFRPHADGTFISGNTVLRIIGHSAVDLSTGSSRPERLNRVGDGSSWADYATRVNLAIIGRRKATAGLQATQAAQAAGASAEKAPEPDVEGGAYGASGKDARFVLYRKADLVVMENADGSWEYRPQADGTYKFQSSETGGIYVLRIVGANAIEFSTGASLPVRLVKVGDGGSWADYATRVNRAVIAGYEAAAELEAQQAARASEASAEEFPEPDMERPMGAAFLDELNAMNRQEQAITERSRQQLEQTVADMEARNAPQRATSSPSSYPSATAAAASNGAGQTSATPATGGSPSGVGAASNGTVPSLTKTSSRAYFVVGMTPTATNTRNPMCYSTAFNIQFEHEANGWGDNGRAQEALKQLESRFVEKCSRHGEVNGVVNGNVEGLTSGFPMSTPHPQDFVVQLP